jgi:hypothetical protein
MNPCGRLVDPLLWRKGSCQDDRSYVDPHPRTRQKSQNRSLNPQRTGRGDTPSKAGLGADVRGNKVQPRAFALDRRQARGAWRDAVSRGRQRRGEDGRGLAAPLPPTCGWPGGPGLLDRQSPATQAQNQDRDPSYRDVRRAQDRCSRGLTLREPRPARTWQRNPGFGGLRARLRRQNQGFCRDLERDWARRVRLRELRSCARRASR